MKVAIYQINMERDNTRMAFRSVNNEHEIDRSSYDLVYTGDVNDNASLEDVYRIFNIDHPEDYRGRSLSVSDIVEFPERGTAFFCQDFGWLDVTPFDKASVQDEEYDPVQERKDAIDSKLEDIASEFLMSLDELKREIFYDVQKENDKANVITWLTDSGFSYTEKDVEIIAERLSAHYDSDYGIWDNIAASAEAVERLGGAFS